jgi:adenine-specific DNA-methyltransferase
MTSVKLHHGDCLDVLRSMSDDSVDLIATDPPYFRVKPVDWDRQWCGDASYLEWIDECLTEFFRILKPSGSIYMFAGHRLASDIEIMMRNHFDVLNHIVWAKPYGRWKRQKKEDLTLYFPSTERIIFAGHQSGRRECHKNPMLPLIDYFRAARGGLGVSNAQINNALGVAAMGYHYFSYSQWQIPTEQKYMDLQRLFSVVASEKKQPNPLDRPYNDIFDEYQRLSRKFSVTEDTQHTDVWTYLPVQFYPGKHPCEKPAEMMEHIINASSRPGDVVLDCFMGSGSTIKAAIKHNRCAIGVEIEEARFIQTRDEIAELEAAAQKKSDAA